VFVEPCQHDNGENCDATERGNNNDAKKGVRREKRNWELVRNVHKGLAKCSFRRVKAPRSFQAEKKPPEKNSLRHGRRRNDKQRKKGAFRDLSKGSLTCQSKKKWWPENHEAVTEKSHSRRLKNREDHLHIFSSPREGKKFGTKKNNAKKRLLPEKVLSNTKASVLNRMNPSRGPKNRALLGGGRILERVNAYIKMIKGGLKRENENGGKMGRGFEKHLRLTT